MDELLALINRHFFHIIRFMDDIMTIVSPTEEKNNRWLSHVV